MCNKQKIKKFKTSNLGLCLLVQLAHETLMPQKNFDLVDKKYVKCCIVDNFRKFA